MRQLLAMQLCRVFLSEVWHILGTILGFKVYQN